MRKARLSFLWVLAVFAATVGCIKSTILNGQIKGTREGSVAVDTLSDFEVARGIAFAGLGQFEGMHQLAPENEDALFLLVKGWTATGFGFIEDDYEIAIDADDEAKAEYHRARARAAYDRAIQYGIALLQMRAPGFEKAKNNAGSIKQYLASFEKRDAMNLLWVGQAWLARANMAKDDPAIVAELHVGEALIERSVALDETAAYANGHAALGSYHARTAMAELDAAQKHFARAIQLTQGKALLPKFHFARSYYCMKGDKANYEATLREVVDAPDALPEQRLQNTIAKRRARRYLGKSRLATCGF
ncbi:MAG TPA: TRAP transporter TatT component family protein [Polyangiaceae bacterium]|jgi:tetratricopeptide (TPR) repeat protein|nr:TRAP transporter TatT component family protein [Polyangiaceae bacterium]